MTQVTITYNPYRVETKILVDGKIPNPNKRFVKDCEGYPLNWLESFMEHFYDDYADKNVVIDFNGTQEDFVDIQRAIERFNEKKHCCFQCKISNVKKMAENPLEKLRKLFMQGQKGPFAELFNKESIKNSFNQAVNRDFEVNVIATMSSGKSTLLNALLGMELLPSQNKACTATICRIIDKDDATDFTAVRYDNCRRLMTKIPQSVSRDMMKQWNSDKKTSIIEITGNVPTVKESNDSRYVFVDTPGPNSKNNPEHEKITNKAIGDKPVSMVIYVLNTTQLSTKDDANTLTSVKEAIDKLGRQANERFIFVVNKIDEMKVNEGESVKGILDDVRKYLREYGIENPIVIPVSAHLAKLLRLKRYSPEQLSEDMEDDLDRLVRWFNRDPARNMYEHCKSYLSSAIKEDLECQLENAKTVEDKALVYSGIPVLEALLNQFLQRYAIPTKVSNAVEAFNYETTKAANIQKDLLDLFKKSASDCSNAIVAIDDAKMKQEALEEGRVFKKEISEIKCKISEDAKERIHDLMATADKLLSDLKDKLCMYKYDKGSNEEKRLEEKAKKLSEDAQEKCRTLANQALTVMSEALNDECKVQMDALRERYQKYVTEVLEKRFPQNEAIRKLEASVLEMPNRNEMMHFIEENTHTDPGKSEKKSYWYDPISWFFPKEAPVSKGYKSIDLKPLYEKISTEIHYFINSNIDIFKKQAAEEMEKQKKTLLAVMADVDNRMEEVEKTIRDAVNNKEKLEAKKKECEKRYNWFKKFKRDLNAIVG